MLTAASLPAGMLRPTATGVRVTAASALQIADVFAAVRVLSEAVATLPLHVYRRQGDERARLNAGPLVELLRRPSPAQTTSGLLGTLMVHLLVYGDAYLGLYRGADGGVEQLACLSPERMRLELRGGRLTYRYTDPEGHLLELAADDLIHVRALSVDGLTGMSVVEQAREALGLSAALTEYAASSMANDARPSGILALGQGAEAKLQAIADAWRTRHAGSPNAGRLAVVTGDVQYTAVGVGAAEAQLVEQRQAATAEIARVFRIPASLLGAPTGDSMTYGNREADAAYFVTHSLRPWLVAIEEALNGCEELSPPGTFCEFSVEGLFRGDSAARSAFYTAALNPQTGWMSRAEVRRLENLPPERQAPEAPEARGRRLPSAAPFRPTSTGPPRCRAVRAFG